MNKQQLAAKIWASANQMRSKIEANEYKDYILGFIFYKYLSDKQVRWAKAQDMSDDDITTLSENDAEMVDYFTQELGYFIDYNHLFSTWIASGSDFDVSHVRDALSAFNRHVHPHHKKLFDGIFDTLHTGLSKLGESAAKQTKAISGLLQLIKDIPMDSKQDYDVLGFIYEYLIEKFAANAGKKAGEFYTPPEVSLLMSEIIAYHLKDRETIEIYDPTSGSGSLLINIGRSAAKYTAGKNTIKYYAQEQKTNTYNLTRMNLVMRDIKPGNIEVRNGDTLADDWPYFDENDPVGSYNPLYVDAVVSNPPFFSQKWDADHKENDPRYSRFGLAPKTKADYAFLLHDLYHLKPDGMMTIVLPHGVLFRGGEEGVIRKKLIEYNHIEAIIGLPANIFFGTGIPTIIMVLRQKRAANDVLMVDASRHFIKVGKNNKLQASDIKRITDTVIKRDTIPKYSKVVSKETIRDNDYNLNIPRYVDSSDAAESWDLHATMLGGIPEQEINQLDQYWQAFPALRAALFAKKNSDYADLNVALDAVKQTITQHSEVKGFIQAFAAAFDDFDAYLKAQLITPLTQDGQHTVIAQQEAVLSKALFTRLAPIALIDKYTAYQCLNDHWQVMAADLEMLQTEGFDASKQVDPHLVTKKVKGKDTEVQDGWLGHIMPFELVQTTHLSDDLQALRKKENRLADISAEFEQIIDSFSEEEKGSTILNDKNTKFNKNETKNALQDIYADVETEEIAALKGYLALLEEKAKKPEKMSFIESHDKVDWKKIEANKDGTYGKVNVNKYLFELQSDHTYPEESYESKIVRVYCLLAEETELNKIVKEDAAALHLKTKAMIEGLTDEQVLALLELKWIKPLLVDLQQLPDKVMSALTTQVQRLAEKYATTYGDVAQDIRETELALAGLIDELTGDEFDRQGLAEFQRFLQGEAKAHD